MKTSHKRTFWLFAAVLATSCVALADWPQWGRDGSKNMYAPDAKGLPAKWNAGTIKDDGSIDMSTTMNVRWAATLGSQSYGNPTIANGRVYVGTNNDSPRDTRFKGDHSLVYCLDEKTGELIWQFTAAKIGTGKVGDWEALGICSSPIVDGDRVYFVTNRFEVICVDADGMADGNDGPFMDEGKYLVGGFRPGRPNLNKAASAKPMPVTKTDADIIWRFDMADQLGVFVHNVTSSSVTIVGDLVIASTSNGVDYAHVETPNPRAPSLVCLNKKTGQLAGEESSGIGYRIMHGGWSSPAHGKVGGKEYIFYAGPDGFLYCFDATPIPDPQDPQYKLLKEMFRVDGDLPEYRWDKNGKPIKYVRPDGPSEFIATPVFVDGCVYIGIGQDPEHGQGMGNFICVDVEAALAAAAQRHPNLTDAKRIEMQTTQPKPGPNNRHPLDMTDAKAAVGNGAARPVIKWNYSRINRSISTPAVADGLVYVGDFSGYVHCLDAQTGKPYWMHDTLAHVWSSTLVADNKVYVGNSDGYVTVLKHGKGGGQAIDVSGLAPEAWDKVHKELKDRGKAQVLAEIEMPGAVDASPVYANGALYIMTGSHLYCIEQKK